MTLHPKSLIVSAINHVLVNESWAQAKLRPFIGQIAQINVRPLNFALSITPEALFETAEPPAQTPVVTIYLPDDAVLKMITGGSSSVFAAAKISGSADFAEALAFVFRNLKWDAEADLAGLIGDIPANRAISALKIFVQWQKTAANNAAQNIKEYLSDESHQIISHQEIDTFGQTVNILRDDVARLEKRISRL